MGWMRIMGADSVEYHRATVLGRADDHPGMAMEYYASRGETTLVWGGSGRQELGLSGPVTAESYEAVFGVGGAKDPRTGERLVMTRRPGMEIVISAPLCRFPHNGGYAEDGIMPKWRRTAQGRPAQ